MNRYDANPALSAIVVVVGALAGVLIGVLLGWSAFGVLVMALAGVLLAGFVASAMGVVGERDRGSSNEDLPAHYDDY